VVCNNYLLVEVMGRQPRLPSNILLLLAVEPVDITIYIGGMLEPLGILLAAVAALAGTEQGLGYR
jgi:hypothetical protein